MEVIVRPNDIVLSYLGKQELKKHTKYVKPFFCHVVKYEGKSLVFNTLNKSLIEIEIYDEIFEHNDCISEEKLFLIENYFYVTEDFNQFEVCHQIKSFLKNIKFKNGISNFDIFPTTDCNARCYYCFEHGSKRYSMTKKVAADVAKYISEISNGSKIKMNWFGGEPLYNMEAIDIICSYMKDVGVEFHSTMITNGYLFTDEVIEKAVTEWRLKTVQITLDGTEKVYNSIKAYIYKNDTNPFRRVLNNIKKLLDASIRVHIRLNISEKNVDDLYALVNIIESEIGSHERLNVYTWLLYDNRGANAKIKTIYERHNMLTDMYKLEEYISNKKLKKSSIIKSKFRSNSCMADDDSHITILPSGYIGKCDHHLDSEYIGNIYEDGFDKAKIAEWKTYRSHIALCEKCPAYMECYILNKCPDTISKECDEFEQKIRLYKLEQQMVDTFKIVKNSKGS